MERGCSPTLTRVLLALRDHRPCEMRTASAMWAHKQGDLCFMQDCGHQVQWVFLEEWGYNQDRIAWGLATGE